MARHAALAGALAEPLALLIQALQGRLAFTHILAPGTTSGARACVNAAGSVSQERPTEKPRSSWHCPVAPSGCTLFE